MSRAASRRTGSPARKAKGPRAKADTRAHAHRGPRKRRAAAEGSVDAEDIARFSALADEWWDAKGKLRPLHALNPTRLGFIRDRLCAHFGRGVDDSAPFKGLDLLDVGCGGGLLAEPLARLGAGVVGIDAAEESIRAAAVHAQESGLAIDYRVATAETLAEEKQRFDVILAMEVVEHVADLEGFLAACSTLLKAGGAMVIATLNRTPRAFALAIVGAEYVLRWLPRGSHDWRKFVPPSELGAVLRANGVTVATLTGVTYNPLTDRWNLSRDLSVNYMAFATKGR